MKCKFHEERIFASSRHIESQVDHKLQGEKSKCAAEKVEESGQYFDQMIINNNPHHQ